MAQFIAIFLYLVRIVLRRFKRRYGSEFSVGKEELSFAELVALAFENPPTGPKVIFTITYRRGHGDKPEGTLKPGESVRVKEGMIFNVTPTDQS